jgi:hypothetical protein
VSKFIETEMLNEGFEVGLEGCHEDSDIEIGVLLEPQCEVISLTQDCYTVGHVTYATHQLLVSCASGPPTPHLPVETSRYHEANTQLVTPLLVPAGN